MGIFDSLKKLVVGQDFSEGLKIENDQLLKSYLQRTETINSLEATVERLSDEALTNMTDVLRSRLSEKDSLNDILEEAFAVAREASWRVLELRHFDVQVTNYIYDKHGFQYLIHRLVSQCNDNDGYVCVWENSW